MEYCGPWEIVCICLVGIAIGWVITLIAVVNLQHLNESNLSPGQIPVAVVRFAAESKCWEF